MLLVQDVTERKKPREPPAPRREPGQPDHAGPPGVAHEIKNPLGSMGIHIQLIQRSLKAGKPLDEAGLGRDLEVHQ